MPGTCEFYHTLLPRGTNQLSKYRIDLPSIFLLGQRHFALKERWYTMLDRGFRPRRACLGGAMILHYHTRLQKGGRESLENSAGLRP